MGTLSAYAPSKVFSFLPLNSNAVPKRIEIKEMTDVHFIFDAQEFRVLYRWKDDQYNLYLIRVCECYM